MRFWVPKKITGMLKRIATPPFMTGCAQLLLKCYKNAHSGPFIVTKTHAHANLVHRKPFQHGCNHFWHPESHFRAQNNDLSHNFAPNFASESRFCLKSCISHADQVCKRQERDRNSMGSLSKPISCMGKRFLMSKQQSGVIYSTKMGGQGAILVLEWSILDQNTTKPWRKLTSAVLQSRFYTPQDM